MDDNTIACEKCGHAIHIGEHPFCPHGFGTGVVEGDEIDVYIKHGLCHPDGTAKRYRSREQLRRDADAAGLTNVVRHVGTKDGDKSKFTSRWV